MTDRLGSSEDAAAPADASPAVRAARSSHDIIAERGAGADGNASVEGISALADGATFAHGTVNAQEPQHRKVAERPASRLPIHHSRGASDGQLEVARSALSEGTLSCTGSPAHGPGGAASATHWMPAAGAAYHGEQGHGADVQHATASLAEQGADGDNAARVSPPQRSTPRGVPAEPLPEALVPVSLTASKQPEYSASTGDGSRPAAMPNGHCTADHSVGYAAAAAAAATDVGDRDASPVSPSRGQLGFEDRLALAAIGDRGFLASPVKAAECPPGSSVSDRLASLQEVSMQMPSLACPGPCCWLL